MQIENYSDKYDKDIVEIIKNFHAESLSEYDNTLDADTLLKTVSNIGKANVNNVFLLILNGRCEGILAGMEIVSFLNKKRIYQELIWYINEKHRGHGVALLKKVEETLKESGFDSIIMAVMENSKTDKIKGLYGYMGYTAFESHWIRSL